MMSQRRASGGFTLIELMIVVAIIGILAAIAIPAYRDFQVRGKISEILASMTRCKVAVSEFYQSNSGWNTSSASPINVSAIGLCNQQASTYVAGSLLISGTGVITARERNTGATPAGEAITLRPENAASEIISWTCGSRSDGTGIDGRFLPGSCQG